MKIFVQCYIIMLDRKMLEDSPTQNPLHFLLKRKPKTHSVKEALRSKIKHEITLEYSTSKKTANFTRLVKG